MTPEEEKQQQEFINQILLKDWKEFADRVNVFIAEGYFALAITVGHTRKTFALTPRLAKLLTQFLSDQVVSYEKQLGEINTGIRSPFQQSDLQKPDKNSEQKQDGDDASNSETPNKKKK